MDIAQQEKLVTQQIRRIADVIVETVAECGGAPSSTIYMAMQQRFSWWTLEVHEKVITALVGAKRLTRSNHFLTVP